MGCNKQGFFNPSFFKQEILTQKKSEGTFLYRTVFRGFAAVSMLFILGCGGDPDPQLSDQFPPQQPAAEAPIDQPVPDQPAPGQESAPEDATPEDGATENASETPAANGDATEAAAEPEPTFTAADFNSEIKQPEPEPEETDPTPKPIPEDPNAALISMLRDGKSQQEIDAAIKAKLRARDDDVSKWELVDIYSAHLENDPKLKLALVSFAQRNAGNRYLAMFLTKALQPQEPVQTPNPVGSIGGMSGEPGMPQHGMPNYGPMGGGMNQGMAANQTRKLDQQTAECIVYALAINNTSQAANTLQEIVKNKNFKVVHPQTVTKAAIKGLAFMSAGRAENDKVLFTVLTSPEKYRDPGTTTTGGGYAGDPMMGGGYNRGQQNEEKRLTAEQLCQEAEKTLKPIASAGLRKMLAEYLLKSTTPLKETDRFGPWLADPLPMNIPGQLVIYQKKAYETPSKPLDDFLSKLEESFTLYSGAAIARLLDIMKTTPDLSLLGQVNPSGMGMGMPQQPTAGWGSGGGGYGMGMGMPGGQSGGYGNNPEELLAEYFAQITKQNKLSAEQELIKLTKQIWNNSTTSAIATRLNQQAGMYNTTGNYGGMPMGGGSSTNADQDVELACTMPFDKIRHAMLKRCKSHYQSGPNSALGNALGQSNSQGKGMDPVVAAANVAMGNMGGIDKSKLLPVDPGLLVVIKMLHRKDPNAPADTPKGRGGRNPAPAAPNTGTGNNVQHQWFNTSQQLATKILAQCWQASTTNTQVEKKDLDNDGTPDDPCPMAPHRGADIVKRLDFTLPGQAPGSISNLPADPLEVHYIRIEETTNLQKVLNYYKRAVKGQNHLLGNNLGYWFDTITEGSKPGTKRSVDVVISPGIPKPIDPLTTGRSARPPKGVPIVVQILTIETADPSN